MPEVKQAVLIASLIGPGKTTAVSRCSPDGAQRNPGSCIPADRCRRWERTAL